MQPEAELIVRHSRHTGTARTRPQAGATGRRAVNKVESLRVRLRRTRKLAPPRTDPGVLRLVNIGFCLGPVPSRLDQPSRRTPAPLAAGRLLDALQSDYGFVELFKFLAEQSQYSGDVYPNIICQRLALCLVRFLRIISRHLVREEPPIRFRYTSVPVLEMSYSAEPLCPSIIATSSRTGTAAPFVSRRSKSNGIANSVPPLA